ncbi:AI-2E family transporter [candidate division WS5 bacterium]|uniref:AI-2E family transporter n=1 Tax=candidate division WS5 bacterium TaxID=2093353 RepID=A0A419DFI5_9BACT|nr:MAG: AI-2E family transporter [candidate division WS5 bacterium]
MKKNSIKLDISLSLILKVIGILLFVYFLFLIRDVLVILGISFILSAALEPVVDKLQKKFRMPRWAGVLTIYALFIAMLYVFISMVAPILNEQVRNLIANRENYSNDIDRMIASWPAEVQDKVKEAVRAVPDEIRSWRVGDISDRAFGIFSGIGSFIAILVISAYILSLKNGMKQTVSAFVPESRRELFLKIFGEITRKMSLWFRGQLLLSLTVGVVTFIGLSIMGIPYALILAMIAAFTELIPIIGPILGAIPAVVVALFVSPLMAVIVGSFYIFVQQLENHILVPQVMRKAVGLNPVIIISSMLIGAKLLGILGVILAVPVASSISVIIRQWPKGSVKKN